MPPAASGKGFCIVQTRKGKSIISHMHDFIVRVYHMGCKYIWHGYVRAMIRKFPERRRQYEEMLDTLPGSLIDGLPHGHNYGDSVGGRLVKIESSAVYKEYSAVRSALAKCQGTNPDFMEFVKLYYWRRPGLSIEAVADRLHYSPETIRKWNQKIIYTTAHYRGLLD